MTTSHYDELIKSAIRAAIPASAPASDAAQFYGQAGDFFGGIWGTIIGAVTLLIVLATWLSSRKIDERSKRYQIFAEMLRTHEEIVSSIRLGSLAGREALSEILSEFYSCYEQVISMCTKDSLQLTLLQRIDAAFILTYYGALPQTATILGGSHPRLNAKAICDSIAKRKKSTYIRDIRTRLAQQIEGDPAERQAWHEAIAQCFEILDKSELASTEKNALRVVLAKSQRRPHRDIDRGRLVEMIENYTMRSEFGGHQNRLSHYFRNLYGAFSYLENQPFSRRERTAMGKILRTKLSNYEQALLALNILSSQGSSWISTGLIDRYMPIKNIPRHFFTFDPAFKIEEVFPNVEFEWMPRKTLWGRIWP